MRKTLKLSMTMTDLLGKSSTITKDINEHDMDKHVLHTQNDHDRLDEENSQAVDDNNRPAGEVPRVVVDNNYNDLEAIPQTVVDQNDIEGSVGAIPQSLDVVSPLNELFLKQFTNNYHLIAQKQSDNEVGLVIRALILKNKEVIYNYSLKIISTDNVPNSTIAVANAMCNLYFTIATKGDTLTCSLGAGHNGVQTSITRNLHISKLITTLNKIKVKTGLYTIVVATKCNWSEFYGGDIINEDLVVEPNKKVILPTIDAHLNNLWCRKWSGLKGHRQTKYWFTKPDPFLATKLMNMSRENLGKCIQIFPAMDGGKNTLTQQTLVATESVDSDAKKVLKNLQCTFSQNVLHSLIPEGVF